MLPAFLAPVDAEEVEDPSQDGDVEERYTKTGMRQTCGFSWYTRSIYRFAGTSAYSAQS